MVGIPFGKQRHDVAGMQTSSDCLGIVTAVPYQAIRTMPWASTCSLQRWDVIDKCKRLLGVVAIGPSELNRQWNALPITNQMTLAAEFGPIGRIGAGLRQRTLEAVRKRRRGEPTLPIPPDAPISLAQAAERTGISISTLHDWRRKQYFPEPKHHCHGLWFSEKQVLLLRNLKEFFRVYGKRPWNVKQELLKGAVESIGAGWDQVGSS
jgi:hypothetical protein